MTFTCSCCRKLLDAHRQMSGELCPLCETGFLTQVGKVTANLLRESERA